MSIDPEPLLDIAQAAQFLHVSESSLRRWTNAGLLFCQRVGRKRERRFRRSDLVSVLEQGSEPRVNAAPPTAPQGQYSMIGGIRVALGSHFCSFYDSDEARIHQAAAFLADGFGADCVVFVVAEADVRQAIVERLLRAHAALPTDIHDARLRFLEYASTTDEQWEIWETSLRGAIREGARSLRAVGDVSGGRLARASAAAQILDYEREYDRRIARRFPLVTLCQYDARTLTGLDVSRQLGCHGDVFAYPAKRLLG